MRGQPASKTSGRTIVLVLILAFVVLEFVHRTFGSLSIVEGSSMSPTFRPHDVVQAKTACAESRRGDVVIITDNQGASAIKRILALPGETLTIYRGFIYINGHRLYEPYLPKHMYTYNSNEEDERPFVWHLGASQYFVLGDNRFESYDSRHYGPVERRQINRVVSLPENAAEPEFCGIILSETGKVIPGKYNRPGPSRLRSSNTLPLANAKS